MGQNVYSIMGPVGKEIQVPFNYSNGEYENVNFADYYKENGYAVYRNLFSKEDCLEVLKSFKAEVKPYKGFLYRQASANPERHHFTSEGNMINSLLNLQSLDRKRFPFFSKKTVDLLTSKKLVGVLNNLYSENPKMVQSMYFEGNPSTWAHQDTYYLDSEKIGEMCGVWIALEDIHPGAGRFYVYPKSHQIDIEKNGGDFDIAFNHDRYKNLVKNIIIDKDLECKAPPLKAGDVLFWNSKTIHGSLITSEFSKSRNSITGHYIPENQRFLQFQKIIKPLHLETHNGIQLNTPKNLNKTKNKLIFSVEYTFPKLFQRLKKQMIRLKLKD